MLALVRVEGAAVEAARVHRHVVQPRVGTLRIVPRVELDRDGVAQRAVADAKSRSKSFALYFIAIDGSSGAAADAAETTARRRLCALALRAAEKEICAATIAASASAIAMVFLRSLARYAESDPPPHGFRTAAALHRGMTQGRSQSVGISGESGAGKTEVNKQCMNYLVWRACDESSDLSNRILESNPVLEGLGNADVDVGRGQVEYPVARAQGRLLICLTCQLLWM